MADGGLGAVGAFSDGLSSDGLSSADWLSTASTLFKGFGGAGSPKPTGPSPSGPSSASQSNGYTFDGSNWTVATGGSKATASNASGTGLKLPAMPSWEVAALIAFGMLVWLKSHKNK